MKAMLLRETKPIEERPLELVELPLPGPGPGEVRLQVQACPPGVPFGHTACLEQSSTTWIRLSNASGEEVKRILNGLDENVLYRWRARPLYNSPLQLLLLLYYPYLSVLTSMVQEHVHHLYEPKCLLCFHAFVGHRHE